MTLDQMRYVLGQVEQGEDEDQQVCLYLTNGVQLTGMAWLVEPGEAKGAGIVHLEGGSAEVIAFVEVGAIAAVKLVVPEDELEEQVSEARVEH